MAYTATPEDIQAIRYELNDTEAGLYILDDATITYYLEKNSGSISTASVECARAILLRLSMKADDRVVDVLTIKKRSAQEYRLALELYLKDPSLNPFVQNAGGYAGGISKSDMQANNDDCDNVVNSLSVKELEHSCYNSSSNPFSI